MQQIDIITGPCGAGKTRSKLNQIIGTTGRYLYAVEKVSLLTEIADELSTMSRELGVHIDIVPIASSKKSDTSLNEHIIQFTKNCRADILALPGTFENERHPHVVAIVTHKSLLSVPSDGFGSWNLVIDEIPSIMAFETLSTEAIGPWFADNFALTPMDDGKHATVSLKSHLTRTALGRDVLLAPLVNFYDRVQSPYNAVTANVTDWSLTTEKRAQWSWWSIWNVDQLAGFGSVTMMANNFKSSVFYSLISTQNPDIVWNEISVQPWTAFAHRNLTINYFAEKHRASATLFKSDIGIGYLSKIGDWLRSNSVADDHIYTTNMFMQSAIGTIPGKALSPRQAGSNEWSGRTSASIIYSAKPGDTERSVARSVGIDPQAMVREREIEAIIQFACRTAVRDPRSTANITINVYDRYQADCLAAYFADSPHVCASINLINLGFALVVRKSSNDPIIVKSAADIAREKTIRSERAKLGMAALRAKRREASRSDIPRKTLTLVRP